MTGPRLLILGLDAATLSLISPWAKAGLLPHFAYLQEKSRWGPLQSTQPPMTPVAWNTFATGQNPGQHGVFDFVARRANSYAFERVTGASRQSQPFWQRLDALGCPVGLVNLPMSYPPDPLKHGFVVAGLDTPSETSPYVHPPELKPILQKQGYQLAPQPNTPAETYASFAQSLAMRRQAFAHLRQNVEWQVLMLTLMQLDAAQHFYWQEMTTQHPQYGSLILHLYQAIDDLIGELLAELDEQDDETYLLILSDHGAGPLKHSVSINRWLMEAGYLTLKQGPAAQNSPGQKLFHRLRQQLPPRLKSYLKRLLPQNEAFSYLLASQIDWEHTRAFSLGESGGIYLNRVSQNPAGIVSEGAYLALRAEISAGLQDLTDPETGQAVLQAVHRAEDCYHGPQMVHAPDLVLEWADGYEARSPLAESLAESTVFAQGPYAPLTGTYRTGCHRPEGVFFLYGPGLEPQYSPSARLIDVPPTIFKLLNLPPPSAFEGVSLL